jgi:hypothetical protein
MTLPNDPKEARGEDEALAEVRHLRVRRRHNDSTQTGENAGAGTVMGETG